MSDLKESIFLIIMFLIIGSLIGFYCGEKSMCNQVGGDYSNDFGKCYPARKEARIK